MTPCVFTVTFMYQLFFYSLNSAIKLSRQIFKISTFQVFLVFQPAKYSCFVSYRCISHTHTFHLTTTNKRLAKNMKLVFVLHLDWNWNEEVWDIIFAISLTTTATSISVFHPPNRCHDGDRLGSWFYYFLPENIKCAQSKYKILKLWLVIRVGFFFLFYLIIHIYMQIRINRHLRSDLEWNKRLEVLCEGQTVDRNKMNLYCTGSEQVMLGYY